MRDFALRRARVHAHRQGADRRGEAGERARLCTSFTN
jgi:hypothetical protein